MQQPGRRRRGGGVGGGRQGPRRDHQRRHAVFRQGQAVHLIRQGAQRIAERHPRYGQQQRAIFFRNLITRAHENAARPVDDVRFHARRYQAHQAVLQCLAIAARVFVPDHQVHRHALLPPVGMRLDQLAHQLEIGRVLDAQQHNGQIARDGVAPQARLPTAIFQQDGGLGAQQRVLIQDGVGQARVQLRVGIGGVELPHDDLGVGPRQFQRAVGQVAVLVFADQVHAGFAAVAHALHQVHDHGLLGFQRDGAADGRYRVQHRALGARQGAISGHGVWIRRASAPAQEQRAVGFIRGVISRAIRLAAMDGQ
ncbi:hypothetical protein D3C71_1219660 [compost metagenome]